jgi:branched-chain amino acid transport system substrate-binding protein
MKQKALIGFFVAVVGIMIAAIALHSSSTSQLNGAVKIGVVLPLTGDAAVYGKALKNGIELALEESKKDKGVPVKLIYEDDKYVPKDSVSAVRKLISLDKVPVIIGGAGSSTAEPVTAICNRNKVVLLSPCATAPSLSNAVPYFFRMWPSDTYDGTIMADVAYNKLNAQRVDILYVNAPYGQGISQVFTEQFEKDVQAVESINSFAFSKSSTKRLGTL